MKQIRLENKTVLVTGAAGFIGYHLSKRLLNDFNDIKVIGFDNVNDYVVKNLNLTLKPPIFGSIKNGLPFLGCLIHVDKIVLLREKQRLKKKKIKKIDYLVRTGKITQEKASERITAILATARFDF